VGRPEAPVGEALEGVQRVKTLKHLIDVVKSRLKTAERDYRE